MLSSVHSWAALSHRCPANCNNFSFSVQLFQVVVLSRVGNQSSHYTSLPSPVNKSTGGALPFRAGWTVLVSSYLGETTAVSFTTSCCAISFPASCYTGSTAAGRKCDAANCARNEAISLSFDSINSSCSIICSHLSLQNCLAFSVWLLTAAFSRSSSTGDPSDSLAISSVLSVLNWSHSLHTLSNSSLREDNCDCNSWFSRRA